MQNNLSIFHKIDIIKFLFYLIEYIYFIVAVENGGSKSRNVQPMNKGLPKPWPYFPASLLYFLLIGYNCVIMGVCLEVQDFSINFFVILINFHFAH